MDMCILYTLVPVFQMLDGGPYVWGPKPVAKTDILMNSSF